MHHKIIVSVAITLSVICSAPALATSPSALPSGSGTPDTRLTTQDFVTQVAMSDMFEVRSAHLALERAEDPKVKAFAERMIHDHGATTKQLKILIFKANINVRIPTEMDASHRQMLDALQQLSGSAFDAKYVEMQEQAHKEAIALFKRYASHGDRPNLQDWAGRTLPILQSHLQGADNLNV